ncbi:hypothetical protein Tco_0948595 [Tanacetum coccineum]
MRPFRCPVTILNIIDHLGKFYGKANEEFFVGYSINSKTFKVFNSRTKIVEENLHVQCSENTLNIKGSTQAYDDAGKARMELVPGKYYILLPLWTADLPFSQISKISSDARFKPPSDDGKKVDEDSRNSEVNVVCRKTRINLPDDPNMHSLKDIVYSDDDEDVSAKADMNNLDAFMHIEEEVYVCQPPGFEDPDFLDRVYKVEKAHIIDYIKLPELCKKQTVVANSTKEVEYVATSSCHGQFWATVKEKIINGEVQLQALVDGKKIIITESIVRRDLQLEDTEGIDCLPNATVVKQLTLMGSKTTAWNEFSSTMASAIICLATNHKFNFSKRPKRKDTEIPQSSGPTNNVADEAVNEEIDDSLERAVTTATSLDISGVGPRRQETIGDTITQARSENVSKISNDPLLARGNIHQSCKDGLKLTELMELCTNLQNRVTDLEKTKTYQAQEITSLKRRVKRLEKKGGSRTHRLKRLYKVGLSRRVDSSDEEGLGEEDASKQGRIANIDADVGINLVSTHFDADTGMFRVHDLVGDEVVIKSEVVVKAASTILVSAATTITTVVTNDKVTLAKALAELKSAKLPTTTTATTITVVSTRPRAKGLVIHKHEQPPTPTVSSQQPSQLNVQDKGKGKIVEPEPVKKLSKKDQLMLDEELAFKLQAEEEEEERLAK